MENINTEEIKAIITSYIKKEYLEDADFELKDDTVLISSGEIDSFAMVSLLIYLEKRFKIKIPPIKATPEAFNTVNNIAGLVLEYLPKS